MGRHIEVRHALVLMHRRVSGAFTVEVSMIPLLQEADGAQF